MASVSCSSSVSAQKSLASQLDNRSKSCETVCTSNSSCFFKRRKPMNPLAYSLRPTHQRINPNSVKQRVMSAKMLKLRQLQSQLNDANFHLAEVTRENQTLKTLQKRQDKALSKYENTNADLPRLLHSHEEEIKVLTEKNRNLRKTVRDVTDQLKQREEELTRARDQLSHLDKLNKDKHLTEREKLMEQMEDLRLNLQRCEDQVSTLNRKLILESKISKQRLNAEMVKHKQCQKDLLHALDEVDRLSGLLDVKENIVRPRNPKFNKFQTNASMSMVSLKNYHGNPGRNLSNDKFINDGPSIDHLNALKDLPHTPVTEVKLEPLVNGSKKDVENISRKGVNGFQGPMENIRKRLSSGSIKTLLYDLNSPSATNSSDFSSESRDNSAGSFKSRPTSSVKLEKLPVVQETRDKLKPERYVRPIENNPKEKLDDSVTKDDGFQLNQEEQEDADEEVDERYDYVKENGKLEELRKEMKEKYETLSHKAQDDFRRKIQNQVENNTDDDLASLIEKMRKDKRGESNKLAQTSHNRRKSSSDSSGTPETGTSEYFDKEERDIEKITETLDAAIQRASENSKEEFDKKLGNYCSEVLSNVKSCSRAIKIHKESLENSKQDTDTLIEAFKNTEKVETKLKKSFFNMDDDMDFVNEILNEEYKFQAENQTLDKNSNIENKSLVNLSNKKKLLATLRAIDNGDSVDSLEETTQNNNFLKERFGHVAH